MTPDYPKPPHFPHFVSPFIIFEDFTFGMRVDRSKIWPTDDRLSLKVAYSCQRTYFGAPINHVAIDISETFFPANWLRTEKLKQIRQKQTCIRYKIYYNLKLTQKN